MLTRTAVTIALLAAVACHKPGRGQLVAFWPFPVDRKGYAVDEANVYAFAWNNSGAGDVMRVPLSGGPPIVVGQSSCFGGLLLTKDEIICADPGSGAPWTGQIRALPKAGGTVRVIASDQHGTRLLAYDGSTIFWATDERSTSSGEQLTTIKSSSIEGGSVTALRTVVEGSIDSLAVDATHIYFNQYPVAPSAAVPDGLFSMGKDGTGILPLDPDAYCCVRLDPPRLYWVSKDKYRVRDLASGAENDVAALSRDIFLPGSWFQADNAGAVAVYSDCGQAEYEDGPRHCSSSMVDLKSGEWMAFADGSIGPFDIWRAPAAMDHDYVYWSPGGQEHRRVRRR